jgi:hypothetical protein
MRALVLLAALWLASGCGGADGGPLRIPASPGLHTLAAGAPLLHVEDHPDACTWEGLTCAGVECATEAGTR